jgi:hypothetical protein
MGEPVLFSFSARWREHDLERLQQSEYRDPRIRKIVGALAVLDQDIIALGHEASYYALRAGELANQRKEAATERPGTKSPNENGPDE